MDPAGMGVAMAEAEPVHVLWTVPLAGPYSGSWTLLPLQTPLQVTVCPPEIRWSQLAGVPGQCFRKAYPPTPPSGVSFLYLLPYKASFLRKSPVLFPQLSPNCGT